MKYHLFHIIVFLLIGLQCLGQEQLIKGTQRIENFGTEQGFFQNNVKSITSDKNGYLWFSTPNGLIRYDGYDFENFYHDSEDQFSIPHNNINKLFQDSHQKLWVGTKEGTCLYFPDEERFLPLLNNIKNDTFIKEDANGNVWIGNNSKLHVYSSSLNSYGTVDEIGVINLKKVLEGKKIQDLLFLSNHEMLVVSNSNFYKLIIKENENLEFEVIPIKFDLKKGRISRIVLTDNSIWIGTTFGLYQAFLENDELIIIHKYQELRQENDKLKIDVISLFLDKEANLWFGNAGHGMLKFNKKSKEFTSYSKNSKRQNRISSKIINCFFEDEFGVLWIGTSQGGLNKLETNQKPFQNYYNNPNDSNSLSENLINDIAQDNKGRIWVSNYLNIINRTKNDFGTLGDEPMKFEQLQKQLGQLKNEVIFKIFQDNKGYWWIGCRGKVFLYDEKNELLKEVKIQNEFDAIGFELIKAIDQIDEHHLLIGGKQLFLLEDPWEAILANKPIQIKSELLNLGHVNDFTLEQKDNFWVATRNGVYKVAIEKGKLNVKTHLSTSAQESRLKLSHDFVFCVYKSTNDTAWLATFGGGLIKLQLDIYGNPEEIKTFTKKDGLPDNGLYGILEDSNGMLWISTDMGISKFNPITESFQIFNNSDGMRNNNFRQSAYLKTRSGSMIMGGVNGLTVFKPEDIKKNEIPPKVILSHLKINNEPITAKNLYNNELIIEKSISDTKKLKLDYKNRNISLDVAIQHSSAPKKNRVFYKLEGVNEDWIKSEKGKVTAAYTNLNPGEYKFLYKGTNGDGIWTAKTNELIIQIQAPWYLRWWSLVGFGIVLILISFQVFRYSVRQEKLSQKLKFEELDKERRYKLDEAKLRFFTNISHDFKTPLALIKGPFEKIAAHNTRTGDEKYFSIIQNNIARLQRLVEQLTTYRKVETGHLKLNYTKKTLGDFMYPLLEAFEENTNESSINFHYKIDEPNTEIVLDIDKTERILLNLYSNAVKYSKPESSIFIRAGVRKNEGDKKELYFVVEDTGIGISPENLERIFDRFYRGVDDRYELGGVGVGLALSKALVDLMEGSILVESKQNEKTTFTVTFPHREWVGETVSSDPEIDLKTKQLLAPMVVDSWITSDVESELPTVLIIDDEEGMRSFLYQALKEEYNIVLAVDGREGLEKLEEMKPQLVISDVMMPNLTGYEVCKKIKLDPATCHIPVILLTALSDTEKKIEGLELGADDYISKPFSIEHLEVRIRKLIESKQRIIDHFSKNSLLPVEDLSFSVSEQEFVNKIISAMKNNISDSSFGVEELSKSVGMSSSHFYRRLKQLTGQAPNVYLRNYRLQKAAELLKADKNILTSQVMYQIGISSPSYFSTSFKKLHGVSPSEFSKNT